VPTAAIVQASSLFQSLATAHPGIEVWPDEEYAEGGWEYFWIVSRGKHSVQTLAYIRWKAGQLQKRIYDEGGEELWVDAG
jgi:hypothetical protein